MVAQFDDGEKGYLTSGEFASFLEFFIESGDLSAVPAVAAAVGYAGHGKLDEDTLLPAIQIVLDALLPPAPKKAPAKAGPASGSPATVPSPAPVSAQDALLSLATGAGEPASNTAAAAEAAVAATSEPAQGVATLFGMSPGAVAIELRDVPPPARPPAELLSAIGEPGIDVLQHARSKVRCHAERLVGMVAQFDDGEKGYLTSGEFASFLEFFIESGDLSAVPAVAAAVGYAGHGKLDEDTLLPAIQVVLDALLPPAPKTARCSQAPPEPSPTEDAAPKSLDSMQNALLSLATGAAEPVGDAHAAAEAAVKAANKRQA